jgi:hypothetical protein
VGQASSLSSVNDRLEACPTKNEIAFEGNGRFHSSEPHALRFLRWEISCFPHKSSEVGQRAVPLSLNNPVVHVALVPMG